MEMKKRMNLIEKIGVLHLFKYKKCTNVFYLIKLNK
jgi:hypothetical protein